MSKDRGAPPGHPDTESAFDRIFRERIPSSRHLNVTSVGLVCPADKQDVPSTAFRRGNGKPF